MTRAPNTGTPTAGSAPGAKNDEGSFWTTIPGILTAIGGLLVGIGTIIAAFRK